MSPELSSETTPLLRENASVENGLSTAAPPLASEQSDETGVPLAKEPTLKELLVISGSVWVGVFFAALGKLVDANDSPT